MFSNGGQLGSATLNFLIFPEPLKNAKTDQKVTKINKRRRK